jgi:hypothetical protein
VDFKGGGWPPPSQGMLCFAEYSLEADGDQVLFEASTPSCTTATSLALLG